MDTILMQRFVTLRNSIVFLIFLRSPALPAQEVEQKVIQADSAPEQVVRKRQGNLYGYQGAHSGKWYIPPQYEKLSEPYGEQIVAKKEGKFGLINQQGVSILPFEYEQLLLPPSLVSYSSSGGRQSNRKFDWMLARKNARWGGVDFHGTEVRAFVFEEAEWINDSMVLWGHPTQFRLETSSKQVVWEGNVDRWSWVNQEAFPKPLLWQVEVNGEVAVLNHRGQWVIPAAEQSIQWCHGGMMSVKRGQTQALYGYGGELLLPFENSSIIYVGRDLALVVKGNELGKSGLVHRSGKVVLPFEFAECQLVREEGGFLASTLILARRLKERTYSLYDIDGSSLTEAIYAGEVRWRSDSDACFARLATGGWHLLDNRGQKLVDTVFTSLEFSGRIIVGEVDAMKALINWKGQVITPFKYQSIRGFSSPGHAYDWERRFKLPYQKKLVAEVWYANSGQVFLSEEGEEYFFKDLKQ
jgi:hypothetical protein